MFYLGRFLQLSGLVTLPWALAVGVWGGDVRAELTLLAVGAAAFLLGTYVLKRDRSS